MKTQPLFIAEASSNQGRDLARGPAFVDAAADAGCGAVKFQLFKIARMFRKFCGKAPSIGLGRNGNCLPPICRKRSRQ